VRTVLVEEDPEPEWNLDRGTEAQPEQWVPNFQSFYPHFHFESFSTSEIAEFHCLDSSENLT
jgi:hypothetical protein